jgi:N-methylhydantoinase B/oxoprolinase/acetone carboxylase alpha subunit
LDGPLRESTPARPLPLEIIVPEGCMLNPKPPAAVVAGNVESSSCVTNAPRLPLRRDIEFLIHRAANAAVQGSVQSGGNDLI